MIMFEQIPILDSDEFHRTLMKNPQEVKIVRIGDLRESDDVENGFYFYIHFMLVESNQEVRIGFNVIRNNEGKFFVGEGAKLYPLVSYVSHIDEGNITFTKKDIDDSLEGLTFKATAIKEKGKKTWYRIRPISRGE